MKIVSAAAPLLALLCVAQIAAEADVQLHDLPNAEAGDIYSVYSALIKATAGTGNSSKVLISDNTINGAGRGGCLKAPAGEQSEHYQDQIKNFAERNRVHYKLLAKFAVGRPYELVRTPPARPSGRSAAHFLFSGVGFNAARNRAVVYMEYGGGGGVQFLTKVTGVWTVDRQRMPYVVDG
ncbi:MAG: hypothetical protein IT168_25510 [Bryobacterales bacterium]|nr:hypothetical protein [Bryobacterales bacterium]